MREKNVKPLVIYKAGLSGRYYATRSVKQLSPMHMVCTGKKEDVTDQIEALFADRASVTADPRVAELEAENAKMAGLLVTVLNGYRHGQIKGGTLINRAAGTMKSVEQTILDTMGWKLVDETPAKDDRQGSLVLAGSAAQTATEPQEAV